MVPSLSETTVKTAVQVFFVPSTQYRWEEIISGVLVTYLDGGSERRDAVGTTFRAFHRIDKSPGAKGAKAAYDLFFREKQELIRNDLSQVKSRHDLHQVCEAWRTRIAKNLVNVKPHLLESYNRMRKPIDLYIMNLVALAKEAVDLRERLIPMLFLPLDGEMFQKAFCIEELQKHGLSRRSKYGDVKTEAEYLSLQRIIQERSRDWSDELGMDVHPIYFDMMWRDRAGAQGGNIFTASRMRRA